MNTIEQHELLEDPRDKWIDRHTPDIMRGEHANALSNGEVVVLHNRNIIMADLPKFSNLMNIVDDPETFISSLPPEEAAKYDAHELRSEILGVIEGIKQDMATLCDQIAIATKMDIKLLKGAGDELIFSSNMGMVGDMLFSLKSQQQFLRRVELSKQLKNLYEPFMSGEEVSNEQRKEELKKLDDKLPFPLVHFGLDYTRSQYMDSTGIQFREIGEITDITVSGKAVERSKEMKPKEGALMQTFSPNFDEAYLHMTSLKLDPRDKRFDEEQFIEVMTNCGFTVEYDKGQKSERYIHIGIKKTPFTSSSVDGYITELSKKIVNMQARDDSTFLTSEEQLMVSNLSRAFVSDKPVPKRNPLTELHHKEAVFRTLPPFLQRGEEFPAHTEGENMREGESAYVMMDLGSIKDALINQIEKTATFDTDNDQIPQQMLSDINGFIADTYVSIVNGCMDNDIDDPESEMKLNNWKFKATEMGGNNKIKMIITKNIYEQQDGKADIKDLESFLMAQLYLNSNSFRIRLRRYVDKLYGANISLQLIPDSLRIPVFAGLASCEDDDATWSLPKLDPNDRHVGEYNIYGAELSWSARLAYAALEAKYPDPTKKDKILLNQEEAEYIANKGTIILSKKFIESLGLDGKEVGIVTDFKPKGFNDRVDVVLIGADLLAQKLGIDIRKSHQRTDGSKEVARFSKINKIVERYIATAADRDDKFRGKGYLSMIKSLRQI